MTSVPKVSFGPTGFVAPPEEEILAGVQSDINQAFGGGVNPAPSTPQGQLAASETAIIGNCNDLFCSITQQVDPAYAQGRMQDAIARIYFLERNPALPTSVDCTCNGSAAVIPPGALAKDDAGNLYVCTDGGTLPNGGGSITLNFANQLPGPIPCPGGTLNIIAQAIPGWDSITNPSDGVLGQSVESRASFEARRAASVALNSRGSLPSVLGAVLNVTDVIDAYVTENPTGSPVTIGGFSVAAHSLYVAAVGGTNLDVATAIWTKKAPGCAYNGNTTVTVTDSEGYDPPYPAYSVTFERPASLPILFAVEILNSSIVPSDAAAQIQTAIINAFAGGDGGPRARIGGTILASRYYSPIASLGPWAQIVSLQIGSQNTAGAQFTATITGTALAVSAVASGTIAIGQTVVGAGIADGTIIISGSGMSWVVSNTQTVSSETMYGVLADQNSVDVQINQSPTISAANIAVTTS